MAHLPDGSCTAIRYCISREAVACSRGEGKSEEAMTKNAFEERFDEPAAGRTAAATMPIHRRSLIARMTRPKTKEELEEVVDVTWVPGTKDRSVERTSRPSPEPEKRSIIDTVAANLHPSYFAAVMATGSSRWRLMPPAWRRSLGPFSGSIPSFTGSSAS
jgi:hypothetical protein